MVRKYKIIMFACSIALLCNFVAKIYFVDKQSKKITILQKVVAAARIGRYMDTGTPLPEKPESKNDILNILNEIPEEIAFTEYAVKIRTVIDKNRLSLQNNLVFTPVEVNQSDVIKYKSKIAVQGSYKKMKKLISDLQNLPGIVYLDSLRMVRSEEKPSQVELDMDLFVFFKRGSV